VVNEARFPDGEPICITGISAMNCSLRLRPLLRMTTPLSPDEVVQRLQQMLPEHADKLAGKIYGHFVILHMKASRQHFGSPQLTFEVAALSEGSELKGLFMPMPAIWTGFMGLYATILLGGFCAACYGYAQLQMRQTPHAWWGILITLVLLVIVHLIACVGQWRGRDQIQELQQFVEKALA
jgi:hypothetical protein